MTFCNVYLLIAFQNVSYVIVVRTYQSYVYGNEKLLFLWSLYAIPIQFFFIQDRDFQRNNFPYIQVLFYEFILA